MTLVFTDCRNQHPNYFLTKEEILDNFKDERMKKYGPIS